MIAEHETIIQIVHDKSETDGTIIVLTNYNKPKEIKQIINNTINDERYNTEYKMEKANLLYINLINHLYENNENPIEKLVIIPVINGYEATFDPIITGNTLRGETLYRVWNNGYSTHTPTKQYNHNYIPEQPYEERYDITCTHPINESDKVVMIVHDGNKTLNIEGVQNNNLKNDDFLEICGYCESKFKTKELKEINPFELKKELMLWGYEVFMERKVTLKE